MIIHRLGPGVAGVALVAVLAGPAQAQDDPLYVCADPASTQALGVGITICDAAPTDGLRERMTPDNLQLREGTLVTEADPDGVAGIAGLQAGDVIYRVGGAYVGTTAETASRLSLITSDADTIVNFLRDGRPYRVKLRTP